MHWHRKLPQATYTCIFLQSTSDTPSNTSLTSGGLSGIAEWLLKSASKSASIHSQTCCIMENIDIFLACAECTASGINHGIEESALSSSDYRPASVIHLFHSLHLLASGASVTPQTLDQIREAWSSK